MSIWRQRAGQRGYLRIGHRGAAGLAPQNTLLAFREALALGVDAVELDVRRTLGGQLVVIHGEDLMDSTDQRGRVSERTLAEVRTADAGQGERVPLLSEVLSLVKGKALAVVDLKEASYEEQVVEAIAAYGMSDDVLMCSLSPRSLRCVHALDSGLFTLVSYPEDKGGASTKPYLAGAVRLALALMRSSMPWRISGMIAAAQAQGAMLYHRLVMPRVVAAVHRRGGFIGTWTVDTPADIARVQAAGVDSITSNRPDLLP